MKSRSRLPAERCERWIAGILLTGAATIPLLVLPSGHDIFRLPKELLLRTVAIAAMALAVNCLILGRIRLDARPRRGLAVTCGIAAVGFLWTAITTALSSNRAVSLDGMLYMALLLAVILLAAHTLHSVTPLVVAGAVLLPAAVNSVVVLLQASGAWNPWEFERGGRRAINAFLGNVNDVGAFLVPAVVLAFALAVKTRQLRWLWTAMAVTFSCALLATVTLTSIVAAATALAALGAMLAYHATARSRSIAILAGVVVVMMIAALTYRPLRHRIMRIAERSTSGELGEVVSGRLIPFAAAWEMFRAHPLSGVGPGCFKFNYMQYRVELDDKHPRLLAMSPPGRANFGEVHNDHLQVLAETGLPGYLILLSGFVYIARISFRRGTDEPDLPHGIAATLALPLVCGLASNMMAGFPLQLAAPAFTYAILGGACLAWKGDDDAA